MYLKDMCLFRLPVYSLLSYTISISACLLSGHKFIEPVEL